MYAAISSSYIPGWTKAQRKSAKLASLVPRRVVSHAMIATGNISPKVKVGEDEVGLGQVAMAGNLGSGGELGAFGQVMYLAHESRACPHAFLAELEAVMRWREAVDERQDLPAAGVDAQVPGRAAEAAVLE